MPEAWRAFLLLAVFAGGTGHAATSDDDLRTLALSTGAINAWRLTADTLLTRCSQATPARQPALRAAHAAFRKQHRPALESTANFVAAIAPRLTSSMGVPPEQARQRLDALTRLGIQKRYFGDAQVDAAQVCRRYEAILGELSRESAATLDHMQAVERALQRQRGLSGQSSRPAV
jgi:hypothetical protein